MTFESWFRDQHAPLPPSSIEAVLKLKAEGATIPFIARYRKEQTGNLDEVAIQKIIETFDDWQDMARRKEHIIGEIEKQKKLTPELKAKVLACFDAATLEDIYLPYKLKRKTKAAKAKEAGLEPLADWIWNCGHGLETPQEGQTLEIWAYTFRNEQHDIKDAAAAIEGAQDILVERLAEIPELREQVRRTLFDRGGLHTEKGNKAGHGCKFDKYFQYEEAVKQLLVPQNSHRYLAVRRGWMQEELKLRVGSIKGEDLDGELLKVFESRAFSPAAASFDGTPLLLKAARLALKAHVWPSIENEVHTALKKIADEAAIQVFAENVKRLLMAPPMGPMATLGVDPGVRTGCKLAVVDDSGKFIADGLIKIQSEKDKEEAKKRVLEVAKSGLIKAIAVGNGTNGRETESFIRKILKEGEVSLPVIMVNEAGASVYSASDAAREEFPKIDVTIRGAISIARRLQDPLAELVKIDPKSIGVRKYQHEVSQPALKKSLDLVVDSCVNQVGVNLNTASYHLLSHVSGIGEGLAKAIVEHRGSKGLFKSREDLKLVPRFSGKAYEQAAGFLKVPESTNPLDNTGVHPERYGALEAVAQRLGKSVNELLGVGVKLVKADAQLKTEVGEFTFTDIVKELEKPGRDPRDGFNLFQYRDDVHEISDLKPGMVLPGIVTNVTNFGAFVDMGVHQDGLVHISQLSHKFVQDPHTLVKPGDHVKVKILEVNSEKKQIALTMKLDENRPAQTERAPREQRQPRPERGAPRGERPGREARPSQGARAPRVEAGPRLDQPAPPKPFKPGEDRRPKQPDKNQFKNNPFAGLAGILKK